MDIHHTASGYLWIFRGETTRSRGRKNRVFAQKDGNMAMSEQAATQVSEDVVDAAVDILIDYNMG